MTIIHLPLKPDESPVFAPKIPLPILSLSHSKRKFWVATADPMTLTIMRALPSCPQFPLSVNGRGPHQCVQHSYQKIDQSSTLGMHTFAGDQQTELLIHCRGGPISLFIDFLQSCTCRKSRGKHSRGSSSKQSFD